MKRTTIALTAAALVMAAPCARAFEMSIGGTMWFSQWDAPWKNGRSYRMPPGTSLLLPLASSPYVPVAIPTPVNEYTCRPMPIAGPALSLKLHPRVSVSSVFMMGKYHAESTGYFPSCFGIIVQSRYRRDITKFDIDSLVTVTAGRLIRIFAGVKYQGYDYTEDIRFPNLTGRGVAFANNAKDRLRNVGPGIGISLSIPLTENLFLVFNIGGIVMFGTEVYRYRWNVVYAFDLDSLQLNQLPTRFNRSRFYTPGGNTSLSLAYMIPKAHLTLTLGGRYQVLRYIRKKTGAGLNEAYNIDGKYDHIYGLTFAAVLSIRFTKENGEREPATRFGNVLND